MMRINRSGGAEDYHRCPDDELRETARNTPGAARMDLDAQLKDSLKRKGGHSILTGVAMAAVGFAAGGGGNRR